MKIKNAQQLIDWSARILLHAEVTKENKKQMLKIIREVEKIEDEVLSK